MFNYDFTKNKEKAIYEDRSILLDINNKEYNLAMIITNKNILLFNDANKNNILRGRGIAIQPDYLLELSIPLNKINYVVEEGNTYIKYKETEIIIYNFDLTKVI